MEGGLNSYQLTLWEAYRQLIQQPLLTDYSADYQPVFDYLVKIGCYSKAAAHEYIARCMPHLLDAGYVDKREIEVLEVVR